MERNEKKATKERQRERKCLTSDLFKIRSPPGTNEETNSQTRTPLVLEVNNKKRHNPQ